MKLHILPITLITLVLFSGCSSEAEAPKDTDLAKQVHQAELGEVKAMVLSEQTFNKQLISNGKLEARNKSKLTFDAQGKIETINVREGQRVRRGAVIATLNKTDASVELERAKISYKKAKMDFADKLLDYGYKIADSSIVPKETREIAAIRSGYYEAQFSLRKARTTYNRSAIYAPYAGKIASISASTHENPSKEICTIIDDKVMRVRFTILESELKLVKEGQNVQVIPFNDQRNKYSGKIISINPIVEKNGQISLTASVNNSSGTLLDGQNVKILIQESVANQLVVPKSAVVVRDNLDVLFRCNKGRALWTYVNIIMANSDEYVVAPNLDRGADLTVGDSIIISGNLNLGDNAQIKVIN